jgi:putative transposase
MADKFRKQVRHFNDPGHAHFLTFSCYRRLPLLAKERAVRWFLGSLSAACRRLDYELWGYVVMPEHAHLVVRPRQAEYEISKFLQAVKQRVSRTAKKWLSENDPVWREKLTVRRRDRRRDFCFWLAGGGYDRNLYSEEAAFKTIEYLHHNPVRRGLVDDPLAWRWSSARWWNDSGGFGIDLDRLQ